MPLAHHVLGLCQLLAPSVGGDRLLGNVAVEDRAPAGLGNSCAKLPVATKLDDPTPHFVHHTRHGKDLSVRGKVGRRQPAIPVEMTEIALE
jgi:hypothetical protein